MEMPVHGQGSSISETKNPAHQSEWIRRVGSRLTHKVSAWSLGRSHGVPESPCMGDHERTRAGRAGKQRGVSYTRW